MSSLADRSIRASTMEGTESTAKLSCDSVDNGQGGSSCSYSDTNLALPSKKRSVHFFFDEECTLPKYRKLTEGSIVTAMADGKTSYTITTSDISSDEYFNSEDNNNGEKDASDSIMNKSSEEYKFHCVNNDNMSAREKCQKYLDTVSESDGSVDISPQKNLPVFESVKKKIKQGKKIQKIVSFADKLYNSIIPLPQFSCNNQPVENSTEVNDLSNKLKGNSQISNSNCMKEIPQEITNAELSSICAHEDIMPRASSETSNAHDFSVQYANEQNNNGNLANQQFTIIAEASDKNSSIIIKQSDAIINDLEIQAGIEVQNTIQQSTNNDANSLLNQHYIEENGISDRASHFYSSENIHQISNTKDIEAGQNIPSETDRSNLDFNLAQLILSLKEDIQVLVHKIEKQENILDAVAHVAEISIAPLFSQSFPKKYNLNIPFNTIEDFIKFNEDLAKDQKFCNEFITSLCSYVDNSVTLAKNILTMLRSYMSKDLVTLYTASKATTNKMVLKDTMFCQCMLQATRMTVRNGLLPLEHEKAFIKSLGIVVTRAKGWHTYEEENK